MSMLKYVLALFVLIVVSVASVCADEGYIPFFPDFLEPDGIGFRGPAEIQYHACWTKTSLSDPNLESSDCSDDTPIGALILKEELVFSHLLLQ